MLAIAGFGAKDPEIPRLKPSALHDRLEVAGDDPSVIPNTAMVLAVFGEDIGTMTALADNALATGQAT